VQIISIGYRRNADVIVAVLNRANGICERCNKNAPFVRRSDGTPFLEVHHRKPLAEGGEDTTENALALCPNCHREVHHG
jgi:5-methylcytosine-specific restriction protein A